MPNEFMLETALQYVDQLAWSVIPVASHSMHSIIPMENYRENPADEETIRLWFRRFPDMNLGVITGKVSGGLLVLDFDTEAAFYAAQKRGLPETPTAKTPHGYHVFLIDRMGLSNRINIFPGLDIHATNRFVIVPPSIGREWIISPLVITTADVPTWVYDLYGTS